MARSKKTISASCYSGCGNTFLLFDNRRGELPELSTKLVKKLCGKKTGANVDGLIVCSPTPGFDAEMRFYNLDGKEAEMCGNGVRCLMRFMREKCRYPRNRMILKTKNREIVLTTDENNLVTVELGSAHELGWNFLLTALKDKYVFYQVDTGVPHAVTFVEDLENFDVKRVGRSIRKNKRFKPNGTNVNFISIRDGYIKLRTYERGVEAETLACGTGAAASAYVMATLFQKKGPIDVEVQSGERLQIFFERKKGHIESVTLKGPANWLHDVEVTLYEQSDRCKVTKPEPALIST